MLPQRLACLFRAVLATGLKPLVRLAEIALFRYIALMNRLTKQEQLVLCIVLGLLLTGWAVKTYRAAHPPTAVTRVATP
jgi:hypothetical protein